MKKQISIIITVVFFTLQLACCSTYRHNANGWYHIAPYPDDHIIDAPLATTKDFDRIILMRDTFIVSGDTITQLSIQGKIKENKRLDWANGTERLIGQRLGFVFNDSVIMAPQINSRMESGNFQIISPDTIMLKQIYDSIRKDIQQ